MRRRTAYRATPVIALGTALLAAVLSCAACSTDAKRVGQAIAAPAASSAPATSSATESVSSEPIAPFDPPTAYRSVAPPGGPSGVPSATPTTPSGTPSPSGSATLAGCPLFPADNPWRQDISHTAVSAHSAAWIAGIGTSSFLHPDFGSDPSYGIPYVVVPAGQPVVPITFTAYGDESDPGPYPIPATAPIEAGGDAHVLVASGDCHLYELYGAARTATGWQAQSGAVFNLDSDALRPAGWTSADAAGLPILPGLVRPDEVAAGHIDHALRVTVARSQRGYISPATHAAGSTTDPNVVPMGARIRLKASFDISGYQGAARVILQALKTYGMFVADNGSNWYLSGATYTGWNDDDLDQLKHIPGSAFEVVDTGAVHGQS